MQTVPISDLQAQFNYLHSVYIDAAFLGPNLFLSLKATPSPTPIHNHTNLLISKDVFQRGNNI